MLSAATHQYVLPFPDLRELEDEGDVHLMGEVFAITKNTVTLTRVVATTSGGGIDPAIDRRALVVRKRPEEALKRVGEYFPAPPQCGDTVTLPVRLHRGRVSGIVCGGTFGGAATLLAFRPR